MIIVQTKVTNFPAIFICSQLFKSNLFNFQGFEFELLGISKNFKLCKHNLHRWKKLRNSPKAGNHFFNGKRVLTLQMLFLVHVSCQVFRGFCKFINPTNILVLSTVAYGSFNYPVRILLCFPARILKDPYKILAGSGQILTGSIKNIPSQDPCKILVGSLQDPSKP